MLKIDLHTHSTASPDGGIKAAQYQQLLASGTLDQIAITDHDSIEIALSLNQSLGEAIIVGEEITTKDGELIGLFLKKAVAPGQSALRTAQAIKAQGGIVYLPHPFETVRKGLQAEVLEKIASYIDIVEGHNGRALQNKSKQSLAWAIDHHKPVVASSDAHGKKGTGHTYTRVPRLLTATNVSAVLAEAKLVYGRPPLVSLGYPKLHRFRKKLRRS